MSRITHAVIMQDKSIAYGRYFKQSMRIGEPIINQRVLPRRKQSNPPQQRCATCTKTICIECTKVTVMNSSIDAILSSSQTNQETSEAGRITHSEIDSRVNKLKSLILDSSAIFPNNERLACLIQTLNASQPSPAKTNLIHSLYSKSILTNGEPSLHLRNVFLTHLLQTSSSSFEYTPQSILQGYTDPLSRHSTVMILIAHTTLEKLFLLIQRMPIELIRAGTIQNAILGRASRGDEHSITNRRVMKAIAAIRARCDIDPQLLAKFKHPHALHLPYTSIASVVESCTSIEALRYVLGLVKEKQDVNEHDVVAVWKVGRRFKDEIVCAWAETKMSGVQLLALNWGRVRRLAKSYSNEDEAVMSLDAGFNIMDLSANDEKDKESVRKIRQVEFLGAKSDLENAMKRVKSNDDVGDAIDVLNAL